MTAGEVAAATALLTRLPVRVVEDRGGAGAFGLVGAGLGVVAAMPVLLLGGVAPLVAGALAVALVALASGALHLDGLADTADALAAPSADAAERARTDPRLGPAGAVALVCAVVLDVALVAGLVERGGAPLGAAATIVAAAASRSTVALVPAVVGRRMRAGLGRWFADRTTRAAGGIAVLSALAVAAALTLATGRPGLLVGTVAGVAAGAAAALALASVRDGLDGDALGAVIEIAFPAALLGALLTA